MSTRTAAADCTALAATVAPEDLRCGDYVALLNEILELPSWLWCESASFGDEVVRIKQFAADAGIPLKVKAICLPFVFVKSADRHVRTLDVRQVQLVRLDRTYARTVWKETGTKRRPYQHPCHRRSPE